MMDDFGTHMTVGVLMVWLIQWAKTTAKIPWVTKETGNLNRYIGICVALLAGFGVHFEPVHWDSVRHALTITITGLDASTIWDGVWGSVQTFVAQQLVYHGGVKHTNGNGA